MIDFSGEKNCTPPLEQAPTPHKHQGGCCGLSRVLLVQRERGYIQPTDFKTARPLPAAPVRRRAAALGWRRVRPPGGRKQLSSQVGPSPGLCGWVPPPLPHHLADRSRFYSLWNVCPAPLPGPLLTRTSPPPGGEGSSPASSWEPASSRFPRTGTPPNDLFFC